MAGYGDKPFGLHQVKIKKGTTIAALPVSQTLKFGERTKSAELQGDDRIKAVNSIVEAVEFELEAGGISLEAYALMTGREVVVAGTTPAETTTLTGSAGDNFPYFQIFGQVLGEGDDDIHCKLYKCKLTAGVEGDFKGGEFFVTKLKGVAIDDGVSGIWDFVQNETAASLPE